MTITETIVVLSIVAVLLSLVCSAVSRARETAAKIAGLSHFRQTSLGILDYCSQHDSRLPSLDGHARSANPCEGMFVAILPFVGQDAEWFDIRGGVPGIVPVSFYRTASDPSKETKTFGMTKSLCSFAANARVFLGTPNLSASMPNGTSNTIILGEHYAFAARPTRTMEFAILIPFAGSPGDFDEGDKSISYAISSRRPSFSDDESGDVVPRWVGNTVVASVRGRTFQCRPTPTDVDPSMLNSPYQSGAILAFGDGSVRFLGKEIGESPFWRLVSTSE